MSEENKAAEAAPAGEEKKEEAKAAEPSVARFSDEEMRIAMEKAKRFDIIQERTKSDENFREVFDGAWKGKVYTEFKAEVEKQQEMNDDPYTAMKNELSEVKSKAEKLEHAYVQDKTDYFKSQIGSRYENEFREYAVKVGYDPESPAYEVLFDNVKDKTYKIASQKGMDDFLTNYRPGLMKEAFDKSFDAHKRAGFDDAWNTRKKVMEEQRRKENQPKSDLQLFFDKHKDKMTSRDNIKKFADKYFRENYNPNA